MTKPSTPPKVPTMKSIVGWWAYTLQGFMRAQNPVGRSLDFSQAYPLAIGFSVNLADMTLQPTGAPPAPPSTKLNPTPAPPEFTGFRPVDFQNPYAAGTPAGFYPFSEIGYIHFGPDPDDAIEGWLRENTCGYDLNANQHVTGKYKFDANNATGVYTIQLDVVTNHIWDYHFVTVSDDEIKLQAAGRLPRPAVGTGILRRMG